MSYRSLLILAATLATISAVPLPGAQPVDYSTNEQVCILYLIPFNFIVLYRWK